MKKNKMMRMAAVLMVAVLATTCALSGSFAKYVGEDTATDSARVAAFGVEVDVKGEANIFSGTYAATDGAFIQATGEENSVVASTTYDFASGIDDVVAPGTGATIVAESLSGTPEVAVAVSASGVKVDVSNGWMVDTDGDDEVDTFYCPITISCGTDSKCGLDYESATAFASDVQSMIVTDMTTYIPAGINAANVNTGNANLSWEWAFEDATGSQMDQSDAYDTQLGNAASKGASATITIDMDITVTQVD